MQAGQGEAEGPMKPEILIVADDVTGALDSAAAFAVRGARVLVALSPDRLAAALAGAADVVAITTNSRDGSEDAARATVTQVRAAAESFRGILFKKVDSRLKGHIAAEIDALGISTRRSVLACPAIPRLGRHVVGGAVCGAGVETPLPVAPWIGRPAYVPDVYSDEDLHAALPEDLAGTFYVGAAGLAEALAVRFLPDAAPRPAPAPRAPALLAVGSRDPVTLAQVAALSGVPIVPAPNGLVCEMPLMVTTLVQMTPGTEEVAASTAGAAFARGIARIFEHAQVPTLFGCGGETAAAILRQLGIGLMELRGELLPGVPLSRSLDGSRPLDVVTKSGGFGPPDTLVRLVNLLAKGVDPSGAGRHGNERENER